MLYKKSIR